jgi:hypothetical protein
MRKDESIGAEIAQTVRRAWRHRSGVKGEKSLEAIAENLTPQHQAGKCQK